MKIIELINELELKTAPAAAPAAAPAPSAMQKAGRGIGQAATLGKNFAAGMKAANQKSPSGSNALDTVDNDDLKAAVTKIVNGQQLSPADTELLKRFSVNL
jgi:hypothetical protein